MKNLVKNKVVIPALSLVFVVMLSACSSAAAPTTQQASQEYCQALGTYAQSVVDLHQLGEAATIDDIKNATISVEQAYADVIDASAQVREARKADIKTAVNSLSEAVKSITPAMTVNEARASIQDEIAIVQFSIESANNDVHCSIPTPTPAPTATAVPTDTPIPTPTTSAVTTAQSQVCSDLAAFDAAVADLQNLSGDSTFQQIEDSQKAVDDAWATVKVSAAQMPEIKVDNLDQAVQNLNRAAKDIKTSMTIPEAKESIADELLAVQAASAELKTSANCKPAE